MYKLLEFIRRIYLLLLFLLLEGAALHYYARSTPYTQARVLTWSNRVAGGVHGVFAGVRHYFSLGAENEVLLERVVELETRLVRFTRADEIARLAQYMEGVSASPYRLMTASVISNTVSRPQNFITINKGRRDGVREEMALLSPDGAMVGYVIDCTEHYAVAVSILNTSFRASGKLSGSEYFGSVAWDGLNQHEVVMTELSKYAEPKPGDEVVSAGFSLYFPADVLIGWVESAELNENKTSYTVRVRLAADVSRLHDVILVENRDLKEIQQLQSGEKVKQFIPQK